MILGFGTAQSAGVPQMCMMNYRKIITSLARP